MKNENLSNSTNFSVLKDRIEERLKIIESQSKSIERKKNHKVRFKNVFILSIFILGIVFLYAAFNNYNNKIFLNKLKEQQKIARFNDIKYRDSVSLLAMHIEIENKAYTKMMDSINIEMDKKFDSVQALLKNKKTGSVTIKVAHKTKYNYVNTNNTRYSTVDEIMSFLKEEKLNAAVEDTKKANKKVTIKKVSTIIDVFAVYPGCESKKGKRKCFDKKITKFIKKQINKKLFKKSGVGVVNVSFTITENGFIKILKITGAINQIVKNEVIRIIESLPRFKPAINVDGIKTAVNYSLKISV